MKPEDYMLIIPSKALITDETSIPDGMTIIECKKCNRKFAVPANEANQSDACCEDCITTESMNQMKSENNTDATNAINTALGQ